MQSGSSQPRLPLSQALIYSFGYFGVQLMAFSIGQIPQVFYVPEEGEALVAQLAFGSRILAGGFLFGLLNGLGRVVDGVVDPWIGNMSDHWRSRFGRRKPFLVVGAPLMAVFLVLFTLPPSHSPSLVNIFYLAVVYPLFFLFFTIAITPYLAMLPQITRTSADRLLVTTLQAAFLILGTFAGVVLVGMIPHRISFPAGAAIIGSLATVPFLLVAFFAKMPEEPSSEHIQPRPSTLGQIRQALAFAPFRIYLISIVAFWFGFKMIETSARYVAVHLAGDISEYTKILGTTLGVAAVCGIGAYWVGRKLGKRRSMILMSVLFVVLLPFVGMIGWGPLGSKAASYALFALLGVPLSLLFVIPNSLLADIIDRDSERSGARREGLFFASQALLNKIGIALAGLFLNILLPIGALSTATGTQAVGEAGVRLVGPVAAACVLIGLLIFLRFPDVEKR